MHTKLSIYKTIFYEYFYLKIISNFTQNQRVVISCGMGVDC